MSKIQSALIVTALLAAAACKSSGPAPSDEPMSESSQAPSAAPLDGSSAPAAGQAGAFGGDVEKFGLKGQRDVFLVDQHLRNADELMQQLKLEDAEREAEAALAVDPESLAAKEMLAEIRTLRGDPTAPTQTVAEEMAAQYELKVQAMKAEVRDALNKANILVARNDYTAAVAELEIANNLVRYAPYSIQWDGLDVEAKAKLERVKADRDDAQRAADESAQRAATQKLRDEENAERERRAAQVNSMLDRAITAFNAQDYEESELLAKQALERDPRNEQAKEIRDAAFRAGRTKVRNDYVQQRAEQFRRWQEQMKELQVPWTDVITLPDAERWNEITDLRSKRRGIDLSQKVSDAERALLEEIRATVITVPPIKEEEKLSAVIDSLRLISGKPLVVDPAAEQAASAAGVVFSYNLENRITLEQALNLITKDAGETVTWTVKHETVLITTNEKARGKPVIYSHDVQDLVFSLVDFIGPRINELRLLDKMTDDDGGGLFGSVGEPFKIIEPEALEALIKENIAFTTWTEPGVSIASRQGAILVVHTPEVQSQIRQFLNDLRRFSASLVTIESKFMTVSNNWIQEIGVDFRGLDDVEVSDVTNGLEDMASLGLDNGGTGAQNNNSQSTNAAGHPGAGAFYDDGADGDFRGTTQNFFGSPLGSALSTIGGMTFQLNYLNDLNLSTILRAVEKSSNAEIINNQVISVHNTQRAYVAVINQRAYIQDFDVEVAQFQAVADPQINVLNEGVVLDVRPTIHQDRKYLTLEIQPTVATVVALRDFSTTLGGNTSPISFQLPELEVQSVFTSAIIPDGGSIMLGGLSNVRNIERRAEVPWVARIPIVGFLFKQEGYNDENKTLIILIRARITDVRDELRRIESR